MNIMSILYHFLVFTSTWQYCSIELLDNQVKNAKKRGQNSKYPQVKKNLLKDKGRDIS